MSSQTLEQISFSDENLEVNGSFEAAGTPFQDFGSNYARQDRLGRDRFCIGYKLFNKGRLLKSNPSDGLKSMLTKFVTTYLLFTPI